MRPDFSRGSSNDARPSQAKLVLIFNYLKIEEDMVNSAARIIGIV